MRLWVKVKVTVIATGFEPTKKREKHDKVFQKLEFRPLPTTNWTFRRSYDADKTSTSLIPCTFVQDYLVTASRNLTF